MPEQRRGRGRGHAVLAGARLGHDARLAHLALHEQRLAQRVVDLVRAGVGQIFALEIDLRAAQMFGQPPGIGDRRGAAHKGALQIGQLRHKFLVAARLEIGLFQLVQRRHERFRHELAAIRAKVAVFIRDRPDS